MIRTELNHHVKKEKSENVLSIKKVSKEYYSGFRKSKSFRALNNITFDLRKGEIFGLIGTNGAGKTTLIRLLTGLLKPTSGSIRVLGMNPVSDSLEIRKHISMLPQEGGSYETLTVYQNLLYYGGIGGLLKKKELENKTLELLHLLDLENKKDELVKNISGGMKRKLLIAKTMIADPSLIFLDEPTTGIDIHGAKIVREFIKNLAEEEDKTIFLSSHDIKSLTDLCNRIAIIDHGEIIALGTTNELILEYGVETLEELFIALTTKEVTYL